MPKRKYLLTPVKKAIVRTKAKGQTDRVVASLFGVNHRTVSRIYKRHLQDGYVNRRPKSGRPRMSTERQDRAFVRLIKNDPTKTATDVTDYARSAFGLNITQRTARNILKRYSLLARRPARKPLIKKRHRMLRIAFAIEHKNWTIDDWKKVIWSDETRFNLFSPDGGTYIRRPRGKRYDNRYIKPTVKYGGGCVMAWG